MLKITRNMQGWTFTAYIFSYNLGTAGWSKGFINVNWIVFKTHRNDLFKIISQFKYCQTDIISFPLSCSSKKYKLSGSKTKLKTIRSIFFLTFGVRPNVPLSLQSCVQCLHNTLPASYGCRFQPNHFSVAKDVSLLDQAPSWKVWFVKSILLVIRASK